ncbi:mitochondrial dicarboxylate carrier-like [Episyrphus balteatus]|uniref:mitochondrial dicarboxylate carrier-like n=1 Tax=Episyrphus balteatus TaxID=286459 RepID=UPI002485340D|nr:mitochondrial dicarboxylate carrier-like [Episyrphus balteatus]
MDKKVNQESRISRMFFGGFSSATALLITHPLDCIKLNVQAGTWKAREVIRYYYFYKKGMYKGILSSMSRSMVNCNLRFELYEEARRRNLLNSMERKVLAASLSGAIGGFCVTPMAKVHIRTQTDNVLPPDKRRHYTSLSDGLQRIYHEGGITKMFAGAGISSIRGAMNSIGQIALYDETKFQLLKHPDMFKDNFSTMFISSVAAGFAATLLQQPFEVVQTKLLSAAKYRNCMEVIRETKRKNGLSGFYKGLVPGFVRIIPQTVITYLVWEQLRINYGELV